MISLNLNKFNAPNKLPSNLYHLYLLYLCVYISIIYLNTLKMNWQQEECHREHSTNVCIYSDFYANKNEMNHSIK